jgi:hypothetical protein
LIELEEEAEEGVTYTQVEKRINDMEGLLSTVLNK